MRGFLPSSLAREGARTDRQVGAVGHHEARGAVDAGAHDLVAQHAAADIDRAGRLTGHADDVVLDDDGLADPRRADKRKSRGEAWRSNKRQEKERRENAEPL
jgi:hypothetical protein